MMLKFPTADRSAGLYWADGVNSLDKPTLTVCKKTLQSASSSDI